MNKEDTSKNLSRRKFIRNTSFLSSGLLVVPALNNNKVIRNNAGDTNEKLNVQQEGENYIIESPDFAFCLDTSKGLKAKWWHNKLSNRKLSLGNGDELGFTIGLPESKTLKPNLSVNKLPDKGLQPLNEVVFELSGEEVNAKIIVTYSWNGTEPVLTKVVRIINEGTTPWDRLLDIQLGIYATDAKPFEDPELQVINSSGRNWEEPAGQVQGYPAYLEDQFFVGLAHPAGFSLLNGNTLELRQHPGIILESKQEFTSMQAVYGVAKKGEARTALKKYIHSRMRRVVRGHDHPYAIIDTCGAQNNTGEKFNGVTEEWCMDHISELAEAQRDAGLKFDNYIIEFWHDPKGDIKQADPERFPNNFEKITPAINMIGTHLGLWLDSGFEIFDPSWTIGDNPDLSHTATVEGINTICRSTPPANQMYIDGFVHHIRKNQIRQIKLDNLGPPDHRMPLCNNPKHDHLPGVYSIEANHNAQIELLAALDQECPEVFFTLYWGHRSPWWLLFGDTVFDIGYDMEMSSLGLRPALFGRSSNVRRLDQGRYLADRDFPMLGWDSLGVGLSEWGWNGRLGSDKWEEGVLMDIFRGSMLLHIWSVTDAIPEKARPQMAEFINLLKASPECFGNPRPIGNPFTDDWWGYCCTNGKKAMIAIDNGSWEDQLITLELNSLWGLPDGVDWDIYCWYPNHIKFTPSGNNAFGSKEKMILRPFSAVLLEIVPKGHKPALHVNDWDEGFISVRFSEHSQEIEIKSVIDETEKEIDFTVKGKLPSSKGEGWLAVTTEFSKDGKPLSSRRNEPVSMEGSLGGKRVEFEAALNKRRAPWQTYRLQVDEESSEKEFQLSCRVVLEKNAELSIKAYYIPLNSF